MAGPVAEIEIPVGFRVHTENTSRILLSSDEAFLNPVQEFNRDISIACIRVWSEEMNRAKEERWRKARAKKANLKRGKQTKAAGPAKSSTDVSMEPPVSETGDIGEASTSAAPAEPTEQTSPEENVSKYSPSKFVLLEALSATGLRSIRYAKEIPLVKYVIANDNSPAAVEVMTRNVKINGLAGQESATVAPSSTAASKGKVRINEGDACSLMYSHRDKEKRVDVVDLDPYGTAAPFIDAAVQCINDGGLLCVTCTDLSVLATTNYTEKCYSNYGGVPLKAEYCHESALRLLLHSLSTSASRYGRYIEPLVSLSIDFYIRVFVRVSSAPIEVKKTLSKNSTFYICTHCQAHYEQPLGRMMSKVHEPSGNVNITFKTQAATLTSDKCPECDSHLHIAGPMWSAPLHDTDFIGKVLEHVEINKDHYGTAPRMKGMLTLAKEELPLPFYFTPSKVASFFHCETPSLDDAASALLNGGHKVSRSHACAGSLKTTATRRDLHDMFRSWIKLHPIKMDNIKEGSPARRLLAKEILNEADFTRHPETMSALETVPLVRYQEHPANWGPGKKAPKRQRSSEVLVAPPAKH